MCSVRGFLRVGLLNQGPLETQGREGVDPVELLARQHWLAARCTSKIASPVPTRQQRPIAHLVTAIRSENQPHTVAPQHVQGFFVHRFLENPGTRNAPPP